MENELNDHRKETISNYIIGEMTKRNITLTSIADKLNLPMNYLVWLKKSTYFQNISTRAWNIFHDIYKNQSMESLLEGIKPSTRKPQSFTTDGIQLPSIHESTGNFLKANNLVNIKETTFTQPKKKKNTIDNTLIDIKSIYQRLSELEKRIDSVKSDETQITPTQQITAFIKEFDKIGYDMEIKIQRK